MEMEEGAEIPEEEVDAMITPYVKTKEFWN